MMLRRAVTAAALAALAAAGPAAAHGGGVHARAAADRPAAGAAGGTAIQLRGCFMTVALVPRPAGALRRAIPSPPDLTRTFYGSEPLVSLWGLACERARVDGVRTGRLVLSLAAVPTGLTDPRAVPLANNFAHRLARADTSSRALALALQRGGLSVRLSRRARGGSGRVVVPGQYRLRVRATALDQPHDHVNRFEAPARGGRTAAFGLETRDAVDRFCFTAAGGCAASVAATPGSHVARLVGGTAPRVLVAFDHRRIERLELPLRTRRTGG